MRYTRKPTERAGDRVGLDVAVLPRPCPAPPGEPVHAGSRTLTLASRAALVTEPLLTVVIPAYNEESRLPATLARISDVFETRGEPYDVLVVVNGSTDRTA
ncbi:MAG TPA: glycosyltransferase, partial [Chloroflexota bacterium]|nr:glycosyltransferase [Chloroflexota bacterium]